MGIRRNYVQTLIFNSIFNSKLGLTLEPTFRNKAAICLFDHLLVIHAICFRIKGGDDLTKEIVKHVVAYYKSFDKTANVFILCEDGKKSCKPAVRELREQRVANEVVLYFKQHHEVISENIINTLCALGIKAIHVKGFDDSGSIHFKYAFAANEFHLEELQRTCREVESDTLIYAFIIHYRKYFPHTLVLTVSRDTDILAVAMAITSEMGNVLGNTVIGFDNPMLSYSKDFDRCIADFPLIGGPYGVQSLQDSTTTGAENRSEAEAAVRRDVWAALFDVVDCKPFTPHVDRFKASHLYVTKGWKEWIPFFVQLYTIGFRGTLFRKLLHRLVDENHLVASRKLVTTTPMDSLTVDMVLHYYLSCGQYNVRTEMCRRIGQGGENVDPFHPASLVWSATEYNPQTRRLLRRMAIMYSTGGLPHGAYGRYLNVNTNKSIIYMRLSKGPMTRPLTFAALLAGTDYNLSLFNFGIHQITDLLSNHNYITWAKSVVRTDDESVSMPLLLSWTKINPKDYACVPDYLTCIWRTSWFALETWLLRNPTPDHSYGFKVNEDKSSIQYLIDLTAASSTFQSATRKRAWNA